MVNLHPKNLQMKLEKLKQQQQKKLSDKQTFNYITSFLN